MNTTYLGIIVFYWQQKGYGYVRILDTREEFRFNAKSLRTTVEAGDRVRFTLCQNKQGCFADDIEVIEVT